MKKTTRDRHTIGEEIGRTYGEYKGLTKGSPAFKNVSRKLRCLQMEYEESQK